MLRSGSGRSVPAASRPPDPLCDPYIQKFTAAPRPPAPAGDPHIRNFIGKTSTVAGKPGGMLVVLTAGRGPGALRLSARMAAWPPRPSQTVLASVALRAQNSSVGVTLARKGAAHALVAAVRGADGQRYSLRWAGTRSLSLIGPLRLRLLSPLRLVIQTPQLTVTVSQVQGGGAMRAAVASRHCACEQANAPLPPSCNPSQGLWRKRTAGYLNLGLAAYPGLPAPLGGLLAASYRKAAPALVARAGAAGSPRPGATATITSAPQ